MVLPSVFLIAFAFATVGPYGLPHWPPSVSAIKRLAGFGMLGWSPDNLIILGRSAVEAGLATLAVIGIAYPVAGFVGLCSSRWRLPLVFLLIAPSWTNQVVRAIAWMNLLAPHTPLSTLASSLGFISQSVGLVPSRFAVFVGLVYNFLPFMVLPLIVAFGRVDRAQIRAARDLYAGPIRVFSHAVWPQTRSGVLIGTILVAIPAFGMYTVPRLLGGGQSMMIGEFIAAQFAGGADWPLGAAAALSLMALTMIGVAILRRLAVESADDLRVLL